MIQREPAQQENLGESGTQKCDFYNVKKKRQCSIEVYKPGFKYCVFHAQQAGEVTVEMVDCPLDPSHQVSKKKLESHLKKCNIGKLQQEAQANPFFKQKINNQQELQAEKVKLQQLDVQTVKALVEQIPVAYERAIKFYSEYLLKINQNQPSLYDYILDEVELERIEISYKEKDLEQVQLLAKNLQHHHLLSPNFAYVEYGAGKGRLSHEIAEQVKREFQQNAVHVLIEREPRKLKYDRFHRDNPYFIRCRLDITDFNLNVLKDQLKGYEKELRIVGVCKHMCGGATDLTLTSLFNTESLAGLMIATCCHHLCDTSTYKNVEFLKKLGFAEDLVQPLFQTSSWYVSGAINQKKVKLDDGTGLSSEQKTRMGKMAKRMIDIGRVLWVYEHGKKPAILKKYCEQNLSPENFIIIT